MSLAARANVSRSAEGATRTYGLVLAAFALMGCGAPSEDQRRFHCGEAFAIALAQGETVTSETPVEDFVLHRLQTPAGLVVIYEGNAPESATQIIRTGLRWPDQIAIHDNRDPASNDIRPRLLIGNARPRMCTTAREAS